MHSTYLKNREKNGSTTLRVNQASGYSILLFTGWYNANENSILTPAVVVDLLAGLNIPGPPAEALGLAWVVIAGSSI